MARSREASCISTGLLQLGPHLTDANFVEVLARAQFRTKKEIEKLVRLLSPLPDVPSRIEPLGLDRPRPRATWGNLLAARHPVRELPPEERPYNWLPAPASDSSSAPAPARSQWHASDRAEADSLNDAPARIHATVESSGAALERIDATVESSGALLERIDATVESSGAAPARSEDSAMSLSGPQRYKVQFTASEEYVALVEEAKALLARALPDADLAEIHLRAVRTLVAELKKRKYAHSERRVATASPSAKMPDIATSHTACIHVGAMLEIHHHEPFARGGAMTLENLSLHCAAHNALAAERDFGREFSREKRESQAHFTERTLARRDPAGQRLLANASDKW